MWNARRIVVAFVLGGIGGAACDLMHVLSGVEWYRTPAYLGQAWWVAPEFGLATVGLLIGAAPMARQRGRLPGDGRAIAAGFIVFLAAYAATAVFDDRSTELAVALAVVWSARLVLARGPRALLLFSIALAVGGTLYENLLSASGAYGFTRPELLLVPVWLPALYLNVAPLPVLIAARMLPSAPA